MSNPEFRGCRAKIVASAPGFCEEEAYCAAGDAVLRSQMETGNVETDGTPHPLDLKSLIAIRAHLEEASKGCAIREQLLKEHQLLMEGYVMPVFALEQAEPALVAEE